MFSNIHNEPNNTRMKRLVSVHCLPKDQVHRRTAYLVTPVSCAGIQATFNIVATTSRLECCALSTTCVEKLQTCWLTCEKWCSSPQQYTHERECEGAKDAHCVEHVVWSFPKDISLLAGAWACLPLHSGSLYTKRAGWHDRDDLYQWPNCEMGIASGLFLVTGWKWEDEGWKWGGGESEWHDIVSTSLHLAIS